MHIINKDTGNFKVLEHSIVVNQKNIHTFLAHYSIIYIASGTLHLTKKRSKRVIKEGELCLISPGIYTKSEFTHNHKHVVFILLFNRQTAQLLLELPKVYNDLNNLSNLKPRQNPDIYIIPPNKIYKSFFNSTRLYHKMKNDIKKEMIPIKFAELIYLLLDSPHKQAILSFLSDAAIHKEKEEPKINA